MIVREITLADIRRVVEVLKKHSIPVEEYLAQALEPYKPLPVIIEPPTLAQITKKRRDPSTLPRAQRHQPRRKIKIARF